jgi:DNA-binding NarL/FixJ family response regulator
VTGPRVLIGDFGAIARLGLREFLDEQGFEVVAEDRVPAEIMERLTEFRPDVVVLDLDTDGEIEVASLIASNYPAVKVIACSSEEPTMRVFPPFHHGESYVAELTPSLLADTVRS